MPWILTLFTILILNIANAVPPASMTGVKMGGDGIIRIEGGQFVDGSTFDDLIGSATVTPAYSISSPTRTLASNFKPSADKLTRACFTVSCSCSIGLGGSCNGYVSLRSDTAETPNTELARAGGISLTGTLLLGLVLTNSNSSQACMDVLPNYNARLVQVTVSGSPSCSIVSQYEMSQTFN